MAITHYAPVLGGFKKLIEAYGKDPMPIFQKLNLELEFAEQASARIPYRQVEALWLEISTLIDDPTIGLKSAELWHPSTSGPLGYAWLASSSLRTAFGRLIRFLRFITEGMDCRILDQDAEFSFIHQFHQDSLNIPAHADAILATLTALCRINYGQNLNPIAITFTHAEPEDTGPYYAFFRCPVLFSAADNRITLSQEVVDKHLSSANPQLAQLHDQIMLNYLAQLDKKNIIERVKAAIIDQLPSGHATDDTIAEALHMNRRTLQRKLGQEGTSFKTLLNETRRELANSYIIDSSLSLTEITFLLGFGEISSFSRAFKRWTGKAPSSFRGKESWHLTHL